MKPASPDVGRLLARVEEAAQARSITPQAAENIRKWLTETRYADYASQVAEHIERGQWRELDDVFWTVIPFGTGGRRGRMYPIGSNAINDRTIGESAQGLASYVREQHPDADLVCAIAYDTRHRSRHFAELCAEVMVANGFKVAFLDGFRSTPELSVAVRETKSACGIMVTASHNPPSDNAVKAYWSTGGQILPPHDARVIDRVMKCEQIERASFAEALAQGKVRYVQEKIDAAYHAAVLEQRQPGPRKLGVLYSPMHGVGAASVLPVLKADGFEQVELFAPHAAPDGDFPNVPGHVANPENPATFDAPIERAREAGLDLVMSTDPDADRLGCAAPLRAGSTQWCVFTGNQIGALLADFVLDSRKKAGTLSRENYLVKTLVTTEMIRRIGESYGVKTYGDLQVGFKWIAAEMDLRGPERFVLGMEESHGYLAGQYARDKDATVAAMLLAELAAQCKAKNQTLHEKLDALFWQHGVHVEETVSKTMPGSEGMQRMQQLMQALRSTPPSSLGGMPVCRVRDYGTLTQFSPGGAPTALDGPRGDMVVFDLSTSAGPSQPDAAGGNYVAVRPSGTEPKVKFYQFAYEPPELLADLDDAKSQLAQRLRAIYADLSAFADAL